MVDADGWRRIEELYHEALERPPGQRAAFLDNACPEPGLRSEIESLLAQSGGVIVEGGAADRYGNISSPTVTMGPRANGGDDCVPGLRPCIGQPVGNYQILAAIGKGGMGEVYLAQDLVLGRKAAVKLLPPEFTNDKNRLRRFTLEAKTASALSHPNIVSIFAFGESEFGRYIAMEWIDGQSLQALAPRPLATQSIREIGAQAAKALAVTHAAGLIHRDIKPDNIMVRHDGLVKVLDFGLARLSGPVTELLESGVTLPGAVVGTVMYMSPEQARGEWVASASDIFSLGIVFYELATGQHPFQSDTAVGYMHSIVSRQVIPPSRLNPAIPIWLEALLLQMLAKDPDNRCSAAEAVMAFDRQDAWATGVVGPGPVPPRRTVGRRKELAELHAAFQSVIGGRSSILCISGEAGQGKTTLVEEFLTDVVSLNKALVARGRCSERLAGADAYLPVLEFLDSLLNGAERELAAAAMKNLAPTWYAQLAPGAAAPAEAAAPSQERLKRELAALLEEICRQQPMVIFIDDVHWADISTVDLLAYLATRLDRIRALFLVSYRAPELSSGNHQFLALQLDLQTRGLCREMALGFFALEEIREYIDMKFSGHGFPDEFARMIHQRTEGNPLFVADLLRHLQERNAILLQDGRWILAGAVAEMLTGMPESVRSMVQRKMEQLDENERKLLMAASVQGADFDAAVLARALEADPAGIEEGLEKLERKSGFVKLVEEHEYPGRELTLRFRFVHLLYQNAFYAALRPTRRGSLSKRVAEALLQCHGPQAGKIAAEVAFLFETARDFDRAAGHYQIASQNALLLFASREAETLARRGLSLVGSMPDTAERGRQELGLQSTLATALVDIKTHASGEVKETHQRVRKLSQEAGDQRTAFFAEYGLFWASLVTSDLRNAREQADQCLGAAEQIFDPALVMLSHFLMGQVMFHSGEHVDCDRRLRQAIALYDPAKHSTLAEHFGLDVLVNGTALLGVNLLYLGYPDQAAAQLQEAIEAARSRRYPIPLSVALAVRIFHCGYVRNPQLMEETSQEVISLALKHGLQTNTLFWGKFGHGRALAKMGAPVEGCAEMREAMADAEALGMKYTGPIFACALAWALADNGQADEALAIVEKYLPQAEETGPREQLSELYRLKGELLSLREDVHTKTAAEWQVSAAERCLLLSRDTACRSAAKFFELRSAVSLARLYRGRGELDAAKETLAGIYGWFTEGFDTPDLQEAKALLEQLS